MSRMILYSVFFEHTYGTTIIKFSTTKFTPKAHENKYSIESVNVFLFLNTNLNSDLWSFNRMLLSY